MAYSKKYYGKAWKHHTRQAKRDQKKAKEELQAMMGLLSLVALPFILPFIAIGSLFGKKNN